MIRGITNENLTPTNVLIPINVCTVDKFTIEHTILKAAAMKNAGTILIR